VDDDSLAIGMKILSLAAMGALKDAG
jgi:hypothetical protein